YTGVRTGLRAAARGSAAVLATRAGDDGPALGASPAGSFALGAINGLYGNHFEEQGSRLALGMEIRRDGDPIALTPQTLADSFPDATSRIAVFVHGLCETDESWRHFPLRGDRTHTRGDRTRRRTYGERLQDELSFTPVHVRYNTGLRISSNGRRLAELLDDLVTGWPCGVEELVLVGHS